MEDVYDDRGLMNSKFNTSEPFNGDEHYLSIGRETGNLYVRSNKDHSVTHVWEGFFWNWLWLQNDEDVLHKMQHFSYLVGYTHAMQDMLYEVEDLDEEQKQDIRDLIEEKGLKYEGSIRH